MHKVKPMGMFVALGFIAIAAWCVCVCFQNRREFRRMQRFEPHLGKLIDVSTATSEGRISSYYPNVTYEYRVGEQVLQSNRWSNGASWPHFRDRREARRVVADMKPGDLVTIYVDPNDPHSAVLTKPTAIDYGMWILIASVTGLLGTISTWHQIREAYAT